MGPGGQATCCHVQVFSFSVTVADTTTTTTTTTTSTTSTITSITTTTTTTTATTTTTTTTTTNTTSTNSMMIHQSAMCQLGTNTIQREIRFCGSMYPSLAHSIFPPHPLFDITAHILIRHDIQFVGLMQIVLLVKHEI